MHSAIIKKPNHQQGMILLTVSLIIMIITILGTVALIVTSTDLRIGSNYRLSRQAFYAAEAGAHSVLAAYYTTPSKLSSKLSAAALGFAVTEPGTANYASDKAFWITNITYDAAIPPSWVGIESHGTVIGTDSEASVILYIKPIYHPFMNGAFGTNSITFSGGGYFDSFDSRVAPWSLATHSTDGVVGTNATAAGSVKVSTNAHIYGNVLIGPGGNPGTTVTGSSSITGTITAENSLKDLTPIVDPGGGTNITITGNNQTLSTGTYRTASFSFGSGKVVNINGNVTLYVTGNSSVTGSGSFNITSGSSLKLIMSGNLNISSSANFNQTLKAENFLILGTASSTSISLGGSANVYAAVYAPSADLSYSGSSALYGSLTGKSVTVSGQGNIHYDKALGDITLPGGEMTNFVVLSWKDGNF